MERDIKLNDCTHILYSEFNYITALQGDKRLEGNSKTSAKQLQLDASCDLNK